MAWAALGGEPAHCGERAQLQQRAGPAHHDPQHARRHRGDGPGDGHARLRRDRRAVPHRRRRTIGVVTRVAEAHSDRVDGIDGVARAKAELIEALPHDGIAILNADDRRVRAMNGITAADVSAVRRESQTATCASRRRARRAGSPVVRRRHTVGQRRRALCRSAAGTWPSNAAAALACVGAVGGDVVGRRGRAVRRRFDGDAHADRTCSRRVRSSSTIPTTPTRRRCAPRSTRLVDLPAIAPGGGARCDGRDQRRRGRAPCDRELRGGPWRRADRSRHRPLRRHAGRRCGDRARAHSPATTPYSSKAVVWPGSSSSLPSS